MTDEDIEAEKDDKGHSEWYRHKRPSAVRSREVMVKVIAERHDEIEKGKWRLPLRLRRCGAEGWGLVFHFQHLDVLNGPRLLPFWLVEHYWVDAGIAGHPFSNLIHPNAGATCCGMKVILRTLHLYRLGVEIALLAEYLGYLIIQTVVRLGVGRADEYAGKVAHLGQHAGKVLIHHLHVLRVQLVAAHAENQERGTYLIDVIVQGAATPSHRSAAIPCHGIHRVSTLFAVVVETIGKRLHHGVADEKETLGSGVWNYHFLFLHGKHGGVL